MNNKILWTTMYKRSLMKKKLNLRTSAPLSADSCSSSSGPKKACMPSAIKLPPCSMTLLMGTSPLLPVTWTSILSISSAVLFLTHDTPLISKIQPTKPRLLLRSSPRHQLIAAREKHAVNSIHLMVKVQGWLRAQVTMVMNEVKSR